MPVVLRKRNSPDRGAGMVDCGRKLRTSRKPSPRTLRPRLASKSCQLCSENATRRIAALGWLVPGERVYGGWKSKDIHAAVCIGGLPEVVRVSGISALGRTGRLGGGRCFKVGHPVVRPTNRFDLGHWVLGVGSRPGRLIYFKRLVSQSNHLAGAFCGSGPVFESFPLVWHNGVPDFLGVA